MICTEDGGFVFFNLLSARGLDVSRVLEVGDVFSRLLLHTDFPFFERIL